MPHYTTNEMDPDTDATWCPACNEYTLDDAPSCPRHGYIHTCEDCGEAFTGEHCSDPACNETGEGLRSVFAVPTLELACSSVKGSRVAIPMRTGGDR